MSAGSSNDCERWEVAQLGSDPSIGLEKASPEPTSDSPASVSSSSSADTHSLERLTSAEAHSNKAALWSAILHKLTKNKKERKRKTLLFKAVRCLWGPKVKGPFGLQLVLNVNNSKCFMNKRSINFIRISNISQVKPVGRNT